MGIWQCPKCSAEVHPSASVCRNCKVALAICSWCRDSTSLLNVEQRGALFRPRYTCDRCGRFSVRCRSELIGSYCNGLARAGKHTGKQLCSSCTAIVVNAGKTVVAWTAIAIVTSRLRGPR